MNRENRSAIGNALEASRSQQLPVRANRLDGMATAPQQREPSKHDLRTIVVLLDGSPQAEHALPHALAIARRSGAALRLVRVYSHLDDIDPWQFSQAAAGVKPSRIEKQHYLAKMARQIDCIAGLQAEMVLIDSPDTVEALVSGVSGADLVVIGSRRRRLASRLWWNNTVDQLRRRLSTSMLLTSAASVPIDLTAEPLHERILVPLDGSVRAQGVLNRAAQFTRSGGKTLTLLNVQNEQWSRGVFEHTNPRDYLLWTTRRLQAKGINAEAKILTTSRAPGPAMALYAIENAVDVVAIATRGDGGLSRLMRGSVADYLLRHTTLPILLQNIPEVAKRPELMKVS